MGRRPATYDDLLAVSGDRVCELIDGDLLVHPRPAGRHGVAQVGLSASLAGPFGFGDDGGPGGWLFAIEPELWLGEHDPRDLVLVPDVAGWRAPARPDLDAAGITAVPDWVAKVGSPSTARHDRLRKLPRYLALGVGHVWIVDPAARSVEVYAAREGVPALIASAVDDELPRLAPFEAVEVQLTRWWQRQPR